VEKARLGQHTVWKPRVLWLTVRSPAEADEDDADEWSEDVKGDDDNGEEVDDEEDNAHEEDDEVGSPL